MKKISFFIILMLLTNLAWAQISDSELVSIAQEAYNAGKSAQEIALILIDAGATQEQLLKAQEEYARFQSGGSLNNTMSSSYSRKTMTRPQLNNLETQNKIDNENSTLSVNQNTASNTQTTNIDPKVFGSNLFKSETLTFEPNYNVVAPDSYVLGPGDEVIIDIWGDAEQTLFQTIARDGSIVDTKIGPIYLSGLTIKNAKIRIKNEFAKIYSTINGPNPTTFINFSLGQIKTIKVNVMGEVETPGTYTLPSLASVFHALHSAGGINEIGSMRNIKVSRNGKIVGNVDIYSYLIDGKNSNDIFLKNGDVIIVNPYQSHINLKGEVKRPMLYEMRENETFADLIRYSGGFTGTAYKDNIRVIRHNTKEKKLFNITSNNFDNFILMDGDEIEIDPILNRFENSVVISGAVYRAGQYAIDSNVKTIMDLINKADGIRGDVFAGRAILFRENTDLTKKAISINITELLNGNTNDIDLQKNDELYIPSIYDLREEYSISINGEVGNPGKFDFIHNMTIEDLIVKAGGLKDAAAEIKVEVARRIKNPKGNTDSDTIARTYCLELKNNLLFDGDQEFTLEPFDQVYIRRSPSYQVQQNVKINGQIFFAGDYALIKKNERLSDIIKRAGGIKSDAYIEGARLERKLNDSEKARLKKTLESTKNSNGDSINNLLANAEMYSVGIDLKKALSNPNSLDDIILRSGDVITIPTYVSTVSINGAVRYPNNIIYQDKMSLKHYVNMSGGFEYRAKKKRAYVIHLNGTVDRLSRHDKNTVTPGSQIIVPFKGERNKLGLAEIMGIASSTTSMAALISSMIK